MVGRISSQPSSTLSTAEAISVVNQSRALSHHFGSGDIEAEYLAASLAGAVVRGSGGGQVQDGWWWREYLDVVLRNRKGYEDLFAALRG